MAFKIPFVPSKKVSFPEYPLPPKFFNDESSRKENEVVVRSGSQSEHFLRETRLSWKKLLETDVMKWGKFLKETKILGSLNHLNLVNFENVCYQPLAIMFEYVSFSF